MKHYFIHYGCGLFLAIALSSILSAGCTRVPVKQGSSVLEQSINWKACQGAHIKVLLNDHPWIKLLNENIDNFTEKTGIEIEYEKYPEEQFRIKQLVEMMSGISEFDVFMIQPEQSIRKFKNEGWLLPLDPFMKPGDLPWPEYDQSDIFESALSTGKIAGACYTIPFIHETSLLAYNKDIFKNYGLSVPKTMEELEAVCRQVKTKSRGSIYGITLRGKGATATSQWVDFLHSFGGEWLDTAGNAAVDSPAAVSATDFYGRLLRLYGPKDASGNSWYENISIFMKGQAAMIYDSNIFRMEYEDPARSKIEGKVGYAMIPKGSKGAVPHFSTWALAIGSQTKNKEAAWYFIRWATGKEMALKWMIKGLPAARVSAWKSMAANQTADNSGWKAASLQCYAIASPLWNPPVISVPECRAAMGKAIIESIIGEDVKLACTEAALKIDEIIRNEK
jgi:multiple sugar transport system substrate-binding protein